MEFQYYHQHHLQLAVVYSLHMLSMDATKNKTKTFSSKYEWCHWCWLWWLIFTAFLQLEQNSSIHVGHLMATGANDIKEPDWTTTPFSFAFGSTKHTVSQPARGHQVRFLSNSISIYFKKKKKNEEEKHKSTNKWKEVFCNWFNLTEKYTSI